MNMTFNAIDDRFINMWHPKYDETERDEPEYRRLIHKTNSEMQTLHSLREQSFVDILNWKSPRVKGSIDWGNIDTYLSAIKACHEATDFDKMGVLTNLPGIGAPVASTFLHFIYPSSFPIIDKRTVDVLRHFKYIRYKSRDVKRYHIFKQAVLLIKKQYPKWSLREIDRAVFAYHKQNPELFGTLTKGQSAYRKCS